MKPWDERRAVGRETWKLDSSAKVLRLKVQILLNYRLARWAVRWVSDCRWPGKAGKDDCEWVGAVPVIE